LDSAHEIAKAKQQKTAMWPYVCLRQTHVLQKVKVELRGGVFMHWAARKQLLLQ